MTKNIYSLVEDDYDNVDLSFHTSYDATREFKPQIEFYAGKLWHKAKLLNIGGTTDECNYFLSKAGEVDDVDLSQAMLDHITANSPKTTTHQGNIKTFKHPTRYDAIWACRSLIHIPPKDLPAVLKNIHTLLNNDGFFGAIFFSTELNHFIEEEKPEEHTQKPGTTYYRILYPKEILLDIYRRSGLTPMYVQECVDQDGDKCIFILAQHTFLTKNKHRDWIFGGWLNRIERIKMIMQLRPNDSAMANEFPYDIAYILFPHIEAISFNLFGKSGRTYLTDMQMRYGDIGLSEKEADLLIKTFRNGMTHNTQMNHLEYYDGDIGWAISSGNTVSPFDFGYTSDEFPEDNMPPEQVFEYIKFKGGEHHASLSLERLVALIEGDLKRRQQELPDADMPFIVGQRQEGPRPGAKEVGGQ